MIFSRCSPLRVVDIRATVQLSNVGRNTVPQNTLERLNVESDIGCDPITKGLTSEGMRHFREPGRVEKLIAGIVHT